MELSDYIRILRKNWLVMIVLTLLGAAVMVGYTLTRVPIYESSSTVFVSTQSGNTVAELQQGSSFTQARINTYVGLVSTPIVLQPVVDSLDLDVTAKALASEVKATASPNSTLITVTVSDRNAESAADIANAIATSLSAAVPRLEPEASDGSSPVRLSLVSQAEPALAPSSPNTLLNVALGLFVGAGLAILVAVLRTSLDNRIRTPRDAELITGAPAIGAIAYDAKAKERPLIVHADPSSPRAESFRALRTNLQFLDMGGRSSFVITSSIPSEGKSTTTINLAIALADAGKRVALLDTDLRKPKVAEYLGIEGGAGLTDVLIGRADVRDVMLPWGGRSLYVLPAGKIPPNPSELLGSTQMGVLLGALENDFDVVLCDGPPLLPVTDAAILSRLTSGALMVVAAGRTTKHQLTGATEALNAVDANLAGFVMSMVPTRGPDSYYSAYGYGYGYGSVYGYGEGGGPVDREPKTLASLRFRTGSTDVTGESEASRGSADPGPRRTAREVTRDA
ncbi:polysaccharide biosynthesis tyrosine autokinase [Microbacterium sp. Leaf151]|uniref:polysaccharide biosynthesis tyrosine autokinase n=1 Tax=Microbacterium sp. Leaf151 TaxID=1736276 RepID=UPI0009E6776F|nr:polysaccharide biosynthesis tyrosine autokinase [Microbacterium sp. Leaf151]